MSTSTRALFPAALGLVAMLVGAGAAAAAKKPLDLQLPAGARVGVVNLLDAEVTHFHASRQLPNSFLKTYAVSWPVSAMLLAAVRERLTQLGLVVVPLAASEELSRARENCILDAELARGLPKPCAAPFARLAAAQGVAALIVLGPGRNDSAHAAGSRHRELPEYLRGWCFLSGEGAPDSTPLLLDLTELLLIGVVPGGAQLFDREWGGDGPRWTGFTPPADLKAIPEQQLDQLQPLFGAMLQQQAGALLGHLQVAR
jgi:hypothetical protein